MTGYDNKAIKGAQLERLTTKVLEKVVEKQDVTDASNHTVTFTQASSRTNLTTGEKLSAMFGKIAKWFVDLKTVAFTGSYNDLSNKPSAVGNSYKPVFFNSNGSVEEVAYGSWNQNRSDARISELEPRFVKSTTTDYLPAMSQGGELYFRVDNGTAVGGRWFFSVDFPNLPMHISFRANIRSYGSPNVVIDECSGYDDVNYGIKQVIVRNAGSEGKYAVFIKVVANDTVTANSRQWQVGSTNTNATPTIYTKNEYDALTTNVVFTLPVRTTLLASSCKHYYRDKIMVYGTGGSSSTPVFVNSDGEVKPCGDLTAKNYASGGNIESALAGKQANLPTITSSSTLYYQINVTGSAGAAIRADGITCAAVQTPFDHSVYKVPVITSDGAAKWDGVPSGSTNSRLNYVFDENLLSVNISGNANGLSLGNVTTKTYTMPVCDDNGDAKSGPAVQKLANSYKVYADISGNAATATNASSVNGMKIERGAYGGQPNTIYFC